MRCLYCGKELALLKRLTGGGDFCSDAHKQSYQEEYNRLALSRLLQAQNKRQSTAQNAAPPPDAAVAVQEPAPAGALDSEEAASQPSAVPVFEETLTEAPAQVMPEAATEAVA